MLRGDRARTRGRSGRWLRRSTTALVVLVFAAAALTYRFDLGTRWFGFDYPSPIDQPAKVPPPAGLSLPAARQAPSVAAPSTESAVDGTAVRAALARLVSRPALGRHVVVRVAQLSDGAVVYAHGHGRVMPASTMKLLTTTAALQVLGPGHRFTTRVVEGRTAKTVVLVGGGDPLLSRRSQSPRRFYPATGADLVSLAADTAHALAAQGRTRIRLRYDATLFSGPSVNRHWPASYIPQDVVSPISALWVDEGRIHQGEVARSADPARAAAVAFAAALRSSGVKVVGTVAPVAALPTATALAEVRSAPLEQIVEHILQTSDNEGAEVLARQVALARGLPGSFAGGVRAVTETLDGLGIATTGDRFYDGSGLSRQDRLRPATLLQVLETDSHRSRLRGVLTGVPVAGFTGSLAYRFDTGNPAGAGLVRAKTGTLTGVNALAGTVTSVDGAVMEFVAVTDKVPVRKTLAARSDLDDMAAALAGCRCAG